LDWAMEGSAKKSVEGLDSHLKPRDIRQKPGKILGMRKRATSSRNRNFSHGVKAGQCPVKRPGT